MPHIFHDRNVPVLKFYQSRALVSMETAAHLGDTQNRCPLAPRRLSVVLEAAFTSPASGRSKAGEQRDPSPDLSDGCREPHLGSTAHSWRTAHVGLRCIGTNSVTMDSTCAENARPREALADIPAESSRGDCGGGFLTVPTLSFGILYCFFI